MKKILKLLMITVIGINAMLMSGCSEKHLAANPYLKSSDYSRIHSHADKNFKDLKENN